MLDNIKVRGQREIFEFIFIVVFYQNKNIMFDIITFQSEYGMRDTIYEGIMDFIKHCSEIK